MLDEKDSPAVLKLIELILITAIEAKASDIHIEATEKHCLVRYRIDGMLQEFFKLEGIIFGPLNSRNEAPIKSRFCREEKALQGMGEEFYQGKLLGINRGFLELLGGFFQTL